MSRLEKINDYIEKNKIYNDKKFQMIMELDDVQKVNRELLNYAIIYVDKFKFKSKVLKFKLVHKLKAGFMIYYIDMKNVNNNNYYEDFLIKYGDLFDNIFEYLMDKKLNIDYVGKDNNDVVWRLADSLALTIKKDKNKKIVYRKLDLLDRKYFCNSSLGLGTDLLLMNLEIGNYSRALELLNIGDLNNDNYFKKMLCLLKNNKDIDNLRELFLMNIIDSGKIKVLNIDFIPLINCMLSKEKYQKFNRYLEKAVYDNKISLYKINNDDRVNVLYEEAFCDSNVVLVKRHLGKKLIRCLEKRKMDIS